MQVAFVIGPYRSSKSIYEIKKNIDKAEEVAVNLWRLGYAVICPHKNTSFFDGLLPDKVWLNGAIELLKRSDFAVTVKGWENSAGSRDEVRYCRAAKKPLYHSNGQFNSLEELIREDYQLKKINNQS